MSTNEELIAEAREYATWAEHSERDPWELLGRVTEALEASQAEVNRLTADLEGYGTHLDGALGYERKERMLQLRLRTEALREHNAALATLDRIREWAEARDEKPFQSPDYYIAADEVYAILGTADACGHANGYRVKFDGGRGSKVCNDCDTILGVAPTEKGETT